MSIKKYNTFLTVVELGSITKAAEKLGHTQSGVTQLLHALEGDLGVSLLERSRLGIKLTPEGEKLYPYIANIMNAKNDLDDALLKIHDNATTIKIGTFTSVAVNWLPDIIKEYAQYEPDVKFELIDGEYNNIERTFSKHKLDFGFVPLPNNTKFKTLPLYEDRLLAILSNDHPYSDKSNCPVDIFAKEPVISLANNIDRDARSVLEVAGIHPNIKYTVDDDYAMIAMVEKKLGICIVPELILEGKNYNVKTLELNPPAFRTIGIAFPSYETMSPHAAHFAEFLQRWVKENKVDKERI